VGEDQQAGTLWEVAAGYAATIVRAIQQEYPNDLRHSMTGPHDRPTPCEVHPAFYGCCDWHSCVEMHWALEGAHANSAFGLARALGFARARADDGDSRLLDEIGAAARRWYGDDSDYPADWEPNGADFLSPALTEAELMSQVLEPTAFAGWFDRFLPGLGNRHPAALLEPAEVSDPTDGQIAHLHGLNLYRAYAFQRLASTLPDGDPRAQLMGDAARRHADAALPAVCGGDYMVEHWLACYAVLFLARA
jgi:hypothetical protein